MYFYLSMFMTLARTVKKRKDLSEGSYINNSSFYELKKDTDSSKVSYVAEKSKIRIEKDPVSVPTAVKLFKNQPNQKSVTYSKAKTLKLTLCIVISYLFCSLPIFIVLYLQNTQTQLKGKVYISSIIYFIS